MVNEPGATALFLGTFGLLLLVSILMSRTPGRLGIPIVLIFLGIGMLAGSQGIGGIDFEDYQLTFRFGIAALAFILFDGGLNTPLSHVRAYLLPSAILATLGVLGTAALVGIASRGFGFSWTEGLLLGAVVSSTDAATVFSVLRGSRAHLKRRPALTIELESGLNDPVAVILTLSLTGALVGSSEFGWRQIASIPLQLLSGGGLGVAFGLLGRWILPRFRTPSSGLYPALTVAITLLAFGVPTLFHGSGFLAVYVAAIVLGTGGLPHRSSILRVHDAIAWLSQITMFLLFGLLVFPSRVSSVAGTGLGIALLLAFVARPLVVLLCLAPFRYPLREILYIGWVGLRGAVPIILATYPVLMGVPGASRLFDLVFFIVVVSVLVQGGSARFLTRWLRLESSEPPPPPAVLEIATNRPLSGEIVSFYIEPALVVHGATIAELELPERTTIVLVARGSELIAPRGNTELRAGDYVSVLCHPADLPLVQLLFGRQVE